MASNRDYDLQIEKSSVQSKLNKAISEAKKTKDERYGKKLHCIPNCKYFYHHEKMASEKQETGKKKEEGGAEQPTSKDIEDGLYKMTDEYKMEMLRQAIKQEEEAVALRVADLKAKGLYQYPVDISFEYDSE